MIGSSRPLVTRRMLTASAAVSLLLGTLGVTLVHADTPNQAYTGCLKLGLVFNVAIGPQPSAPCPKGVVQISWNQTGPPGPAGLPGTNGKDGAPGKSAYDIWLGLGNTGTPEDFVAALEGRDGSDGETTLLRTTLEQEGANCTSGGHKIDSGRDNGAAGGVPGNDVLEAGEVETTAYVCNGSNAGMILTGHGKPTSSVGDPGNFYTDLDTGITYGPKVVTWPRDGINCVGFPHPQIDWRGCNVSAANLSAANFRFANLSAAVLEFANLSDATFDTASLPGAQMYGANLARADLQHANLSHADLATADLHGANLLLANLTGADLREANLTGAILFAVTWSNTLCPDGTNTDSNGGGSCVGHL